MPVAPTSSFPIPVAVDLDFRPDSYVADWCALAAIVQNVTGEERRAVMHRAWLDALLRHAPYRPGLAERHEADRLPPAEAARWVAGDPMHRVSGEYLPRYRRGELDIARLVLDTHPAIVYSVRARVTPPSGAAVVDDGASPDTAPASRTLRVVDEHGTTFTHAATTVAGTLSMGELIRFIDTVRASSLPEHPAHLPFPEALVLEGVAQKVPAGRLHEFVQVTSAVYPQLQAFYRKRLTWWVRQHFETGPRSRYTRWTWADTLGQWWAGRAS